MYPPFSDSLSKSGLYPPAFLNVLERLDNIYDNYLSGKITNENEVLTLISSLINLPRVMNTVGRWMTLPNAERQALDSDLNESFQALGYNTLFGVKEDLKREP